jgi:signal transduction histidine kinase
MTKDATTHREAALAAELSKVLRALRHDLRGPLTAITTNAALLLEDPITDEQRRALTDVRDGGVRMARMLGELESAVEHALRSDSATSRGT